MASKRKNLLLAEKDGLRTFPPFLKAACQSKLDTIKGIKQHFRPQTLFLKRSNLQPRRIFDNKFNQKYCIFITVLHRINFLNVL